MGKHTDDARGMAVLKGIGYIAAGLFFPPAMPFIVAAAVYDLPKTVANGMAEDKADEAVAKLSQQSASMVDDWHTYRTQDKNLEVVADIEISEPHPNYPWVTGYARRRHIVKANRFG